jgi:hypothetical protein
LNLERGSSAIVESGKGCARKKKKWNPHKEAQCAFSTESRKTQGLPGDIEKIRHEMGESVVKIPV